MPKGYGYGGESASSKSGKVGMPGGHAIHKHMSNSAFMKKETIKQEKTNLLENDPIPTRASSLEMVSPLEFHKGVPHPPKRSMLSLASSTPLATLDNMSFNCFFENSLASSTPLATLDNMLFLVGNISFNCCFGASLALDFGSSLASDNMLRFGG